MCKKGFFASVCSFFSGFLSSNNDDLTGVERYIRNQAATASTSTSVENYIHNQASSTPTGVEQYIQNQANSAQITGVERYIRKQG
jgi:hypothetical protein